MRDRLIELINQYPCMSTAEDCFMESISSDFADHLLANGVITLPCKVGDPVYYIYWHNGKKVGDGTIEEIYYNGDSFAYHICHDYNYFDLQQEEAFLTREEAERALEGGE